jgi:flagellum-specific peptidoglycan hydrolase FlgJ/murein DD-endopeptidase MepM/ murein hydrolase activator NlpD
MQYLSKDFTRKLTDNLKIGQYSRPRCVVEVDRMAFIPGKIEQLTIDDFQLDTEVEVQREWIEADESGLFDGETVMNTDSIVFPVQGMSLDNVTDEFGTPRSGGRKHQGIDIALNTKAFPERRGVGTPVLAAWGGKVSTVRRSNLYNGYGIYVDIIHPNGLRTRYAHLDNALVSVGDIVSPGQVIGEGGNTGSVMSSGKAVLGSYSDIDSMRYKGYGAHLHFEIHESIDDKGNYRAVNPRPYLDGSKKATRSVSQQGGGVVRQEPLVGYKNSVILNENFLNRDWHKKSVYTFKNNFLKLSTIEKTSIDGINNWNTLSFKRKILPIGKNTGMNIKLKMTNEGYLDFAFRSNFSKEDGDSFYISIDNPKKRSVNFTEFLGLDKVQEMKKIYVPAGEVDIDITIVWGGKDAVENGKKVPKKFSIGKIKVTDVVPTLETNRHLYPSKGFSTKQDDFIKAQGGYWEEREIVDFIFTNDSQVFDLSVGEFVYTDTITLTEIESCDIVDSLEQDSAEAIITIPNPDGFYSPDYNPYYFPELFTSSPFAYFMGGFQTGVLSNNTPIRIYMGYGEELIRIFTGLIDKVDIKNSPPRITITARDMYKKISDKVLTETKQYPAVDLIDDFPGGTPESDNAFINSIAPGAIETYQKYNILPSITIAQAILESGWGKKKIGNNVFGIKAGSNWKGKTQTAVTQEYRNGNWVSETATFRDYDSIADSILDHAALVGTAPRYEAVRNAKDYKEAAHALQQAGYATDPKYAQKLINIIEQNGLAEYDKEQGGNISHEEGFSGEKVAWLKSAVVQDLIAHAGMFGWRRHHEDLQYPDAIIEESYLISVDQEKGTYVRAVPGKEGEFEVVNLESTPTPRGWMNPYTDEYGRTFVQYQHRVGECIDEVLKDTHYRSYCDRYGTYRLETIDYNKPIVDTYTYRENLITVDKTLDFSRARSHIIVIDEEGNKASFLDKEILIELKSEIRTASVVVPWAKSYELKKVVASRLFEDMKRICRTVQVATPCNPTLDILDRIRVIDKDSSTNAVYTIKGIRRSYSAESGLVQFLELFWSEKGTVI